MEDQIITIQIPKSQLDVIIEMLENFKQAAIAAKGPEQEPAGLEGLTEEIIAADNSRRS